MVIDRAWRALGPGLEPLSGPGGSPLTRTVKLILLPLVVRPSLHTSLAADFLEPSQAAELERLIQEAGGCLAATAAWFTLLKRARRALGIVAGNPQDLYFQRCFELATVHGAPAPGASAPASPAPGAPSSRASAPGASVRTAEGMARAAVREIAEAGGGRTVDALREHLADPDRRAALDRTLLAAWEARELTPPGDLAAVSALAALTALAAEVLDACGAPSTGPDPTSTTGASTGTGTPDRTGAAGAAGAAAFAELVDSGSGSALGRALWAGHADALWGRADLPPHLELTAHRVPPRPEPGRGASTATLPPPLDRTLFERVFTVLQSSGRDADLPPVPELVRREVGRSCGPLGLGDESLRVAVVLGGCLAVGLDPLGSGRPPGPGTAAHRLVNRRWQREASVLRARRMTTAPDPDGGTLAALAAELRSPWVAYLRRLWVRLHGRDVREAPLDGPASAWELLDGVARSVLMDHRGRVRNALRALSAPAVPQFVEARSA